MTCLRAARAQGVAPPSGQALWGGLVPLRLLRSALVHKHDQVSLSAPSGSALSWVFCHQLSAASGEDGRFGAGV